MEDEGQPILESALRRRNGAPVVPDKRQSSPGRMPPKQPQTAISVAMARVLDGLPAKDGIFMEYGTEGTPTAFEGTKVHPDNADIVIADPRNSPERVRLETLEDTPALRDTPANRTMSAAMAEAQQTGDYPTVEDHLEGKTPLHTR